MKHRQPRPVERIIAALHEALSIAKGEAEPYRITEPAPWLAEHGTCPSCDRRRAAGIAANKASRDRARQKGDAP